MNAVDLLGYLGTLLINIAYLPQVIKTIKSENVEGLSSSMYFILIASGITWCTYAVLLENIPLLLCNSINLVQALIILVLIFKKSRKWSTTSI